MELYSNCTDPKNCKVPLIIYCSKRNCQQNLLSTKYTIFRFRKVLERTVVLMKISYGKNQNTFVTEEPYISKDFSCFNLYFFRSFGEKGFSTVRGDQIKIKFLTKKKEFLWPWKVKCANCGDLVMLRPDSNTKGRIRYFEWRK